jgi:hypothetical protein
MSKITVKTTMSLSHGHDTFARDQIVKLPASDAREFIARGLAVEVAGEEETAAAPAPVEKMAETITSNKMAPDPKNKAK